MIKNVTATDRVTFFQKSLSHIYRKKVLHFSKITQKKHALRRVMRAPMSTTFGVDF